MNSLFEWYKERNVVIKVLLFVVPLLMGLLWVVGSFTKFDRLIMFLVGLFIGGLLINLFLGEYIAMFINWLGGVFEAIFSSGTLPTNIL